ncbi:MAG: DUF308 domain-containing protein [Clostridia bacterium]
MKNPFKQRYINPSLFFIQFIIIAVFGIISIVDANLAFSLSRYLLFLIILLSGFSRALQVHANTKSILHTLLSIAITIILALLMFLPNLIAMSISKIFGMWFLICGIAQATICVQCIMLKMHGKFRYGSSAFVSLGFGISLLFWWSSNISLTFKIVGIYLIIYSVSSLVNAISEILLYGNSSAKIKSKIKIALPIFLTALLPGKLIDNFNEYFKLNPKEASKLLKKRKTQEKQNCPLEVYIHLVDKGAQRTGHVDLRYEDTVYSYGCYDIHSHLMGGVFSDGSVLTCNHEKYIDFCLDIEKKIVVGFGIALDDEQKLRIENELQKIKDNFVDWQTDFEKGIEYDKALDPASHFVETANAKIYKIKKGPFRKYYAINTNCVKLADKIIGVSGLGIVSVNGIVVPGAYYSMLNELYESKDNMVIERNIYKENH